MATIFCDLDGTLFFWGTDKFLPGAAEHLTKWQAKGHQIIFTTQRSGGAPGQDSTVKKLQEYFPGCLVFYGIDSPRIVINDAGAAAINHRTNESWNYPDLLEIG